MQRSRIDLHIHSTASDGLLSPSAVVHAALELGLSAIALTDHDTLSGIAEATAAAAGTNLKYIPGVEVNSEGAWGDLHLLGYYLDPADPLLNRLLEAMRDARLGRARKMIDRLTQMGMPVDWEEVEELAAGETVGRPHVARALLNRGHVDSFQEAFDRYIANDGPAYVPRLRLTPDEVINAIHAAGGAAVLAHPAQSRATDLIPELVSFGLQGLEVYHPGHSERDVRELLSICRRYGLIATGGTDFHGPDHAEGAPIGSLFVPPECVEKLRAVARA